MRKKTPYFLLLLTAFIVSLIYVLAPITKPMDDVVYDIYQRKFPLKIKNPSVVFVEIDQKSLNFLKENSFVSWPWPRSIYAPLIEALNTGSAKSIIFDLIFSSPSTYGKADDSVFQKAIEKAQNVYLPCVSGSGNKPGAVLEKYSIPALSEYSMQCISSNKALFPLLYFLVSSKGTGDARGFPDSDGIFRKYSLCTKLESTYFPSLALSIFPEDTLLELLRHNTNKRFLYPRFPNPRAFKHYSFIDVISLYRKGQIADSFKNKIVIVGAVAPGLLDLRPTSVSQNTPGMFLHGSVIENIRQNAFVKHASHLFVVLAILFVLSVFYGIYSLRFSLIVRSSLIMLFLIIIAGLSMALFNYTNTFISPIVLLLPPVIAYISFVSFDYMVQDREKRFVKKLFRHYVSSELLDQILKSPNLINLGGERKVITVMFSDIASFTTISEKLKPEEVVSILNSLLEEMSTIILNERGYIDKYEGDAIMAFWNAPVSLEKHASRAITSAIKCLKSLNNKINPELAKMGFGPLNMRFGINTGEAVVGNIGSRERFDYTAIGDSVNLASRLEGTNKIYGTNIIASEFTVSSAQSESPGVFLFRELDMVRVKGKEKPVRIFEVIGFFKEISEEKKKTVEEYQKALSLYREAKFKEAAEILKELAKNDKPSEVLLKRCYDLIENPPDKWEGIFDLKTK